MKGSDEKIPKKEKIAERLMDSFGPGAGYAGEMFNGRQWTSLSGKQIITATPSCRRPPFYNDGWEKGRSTPKYPSVNETVPPTPCLCEAKCISEMTYGEGLQYVVQEPGKKAKKLGKTSYFFVTDSVNIYFTEDN